jgi:uncharacterized protein (DUF362 family)
MRVRRVTKPIVSIARSDTEQASVRAALELLPMEEIVKKGDRVVITPNWVTAKPPSTGCVVGPYTLQALIRAIKQLQPDEIVIATGSGEDTVKVFSQVGYDRIIEEEQVRFIDLNFGPYTDLELDHPVVPRTKLNRLIDEMDVLVSFTQLKQHEEATISASIKNIAMGWPPAELHGFPKKQLGIHKDLHGFIAAMAKKLPIDLAVISADKTMIGTGPNNGLAVDTKGLVIASTDPVAADTVGARLLGFKPQAVRYLYDLQQYKLGEAEVENIRFYGIPLKEAERIFSTAAYGSEIILDKQ